MCFSCKKRNNFDLIVLNREVEAEKPHIHPHKNTLVDKKQKKTMSRGKIINALISADQC